MKLEGKVAIVTGAGRGIGRAIAEKLAAEGAAIVLNDLDADMAEEAAGAVANAVAVPGSVVDGGIAERMVATALDRFGDLHIIVNNAGYTWDATIGKLTDEQLQAMLDVHVVGPVRLLRAATDHFRVAAKREAEAGASVHRKVVNISSIAGCDGNAGQVAYGSAKSAVIGLTKSLAKEWGRYRVNVNCVAYGLIHTRLTQSLGGDAASIEVEGKKIAVGLQPATLEAFAKTIPLGRGGTAEEAAGAVAILTYPESDFVTGEVIVASGGLRI
jgi:3-oxoacyl-[acyl-carrier protein] reductase